MKSILLIFIGALAILVVVKATPFDVAKEKFDNHNLRRDKYKELIECLTKVYNGNNVYVTIQIDECSGTGEWQEWLDCLQNIPQLETCFVEEWKAKKKQGSIIWPFPQDAKLKTRQNMQHVPFISYLLYFQTNHDNNLLILLNLHIK